MRRTVIILGILALAWIGYLAWPVYSLVKLTQAVEARDIPTAMAHIDVPAVRASLTMQVMESYLKLTGKVGSPLLRSIVVGAAGSIADPLIADMVTPEGLIDLLRTGWPNGVIAARPSGVSGLTAVHLGSAWDIYSGAQYGIRRFEIDLPPSVPQERRFGLEFRLKGWRWLLVSVRLPEHLRVQLAELAIKAQSKR